MWVKSQSKRELIKCEEIRIQYLNEHLNGQLLKMLGTQKGWGIQTKHHVLGFYSTEEKAIKVLNMIEDCLKDKYERGMYAPCIEFYEKGVFHMPLDSEVE